MGSILPQVSACLILQTRDVYLFFCCMVAMKWDNFVYCGDINVMFCDSVSSALYCQLMPKYFKFVA